MVGFLKFSDELVLGMRIFVVIVLVVVLINVFFLCLKAIELNKEAKELQIEVEQHLEETIEYYCEKYKGTMFEKKENYEKICIQRSVGE